MTDTSKATIAAVVERLKADNDWLMRIRIVGGELQALHAGNNMLRSASLISALEAKVEELERLVSSSEAQRYRSCSELLERALAAEAQVATLQAKLAKAAEALEPFAGCADHFVRNGYRMDELVVHNTTWSSDGVTTAKLSREDFRRARSTLSTLRETTDGQT